MIFAIGDWISFGGLKFFRLSIPEFLINGVLGIFRANGRFGWLLVYAIMLRIVYMTVTLLKEKAAEFNNQIMTGSLENGVLILLHQCDDQLILSAKNNGYTVVFVDNIYGVFNDSFTAEEMSVLTQENSI